MAAIPGAAVFHNRNSGIIWNSRGGSTINPKSACQTVRCYHAPKQSSMLSMDSRFWGRSLKLQQTSSQGRLHIWRSDGPGLTSRLRVIGTTMSLSLLPEKPVGLYDPSFERDSCGVGFVAELSGESRRKTVTDALEMLVRMAHRGACGCETNTGDGAGILVAIPGWAYLFPKTKTTILFYWSTTLCELEPLNVSTAMHLDRPPRFLTMYLHRFDVLLLNTGHHWNRGKLNEHHLVMYIGGLPVVDKKLVMMGNAKNYTIYNIVRWVDAQLPRYPKLKAFLRTLSPRHFVNGDWNTGGRCDNTNPFAKGNQVANLSSKSGDEVAEGAVRGTNVKLLDITLLSKLRDEAHISKYMLKASPGSNDCLHWCLPGIPDTWNEVLAAQI